MPNAFDEAIAADFTDSNVHSGVAAVLKMGADRLETDASGLRRDDVEDAIANGHAAPR